MRSTGWRLASSRRDRCVKEGFGEVKDKGWSNLGKATRLTVQTLSTL